MMTQNQATYATTVEPAEEPISLSELKDRLRITTGDFDFELVDMMKAARKQVEYDTHRRLVTQTVALYLDAFPSCDIIELRQLPVASVTSVEYIDQDVASQTFASSNYRTDLDSKPARIELLTSSSWPNTEDNYPKAVTVTFVAGQAVTSVPVEAKLAIVEWVKMNWADCDGDGMKYRNLVNTLAWSGYWKGI